MQNQSEFDRLDDRAKAPVRSSDPHSVKPLSPKPQGLGLTGFFDNYYEGRADADLTPWFMYFVQTVLSTFEAVKKEIL